MLPNLRYVCVHQQVDHNVWLIWLLWLGVMGHLWHHGNRGHMTVEV